MEKFFEPTNIEQFVKWTFDQANLRQWTCVVEYSEPAMLDILKEHAVLTELPETARREYSDITMLVAFVPRNTLPEFIQVLVANSHVLSVYESDELQLLIADDYHPDCFSSSTEFYNRYNQELSSMKLVSN